MSLDLSNTTQLASAFGVTSSTINGNAPGTVSGIAIAQNGVLSFQYTNGASADAYIIPLANVASPDNLTSVLGDAYQTNFASGNDADQQRDNRRARHDQLFCRWRARQSTSRPS